AAPTSSGSARRRRSGSGRRTRQPNAETNRSGGTPMRLAGFRRIIAALALVGLVAAPALAQDGPIRIGYAIARTGPWAAGAQVTQEPNYVLWTELINANGGLNVQGRQRKVELVGFDDRSETDTVVRTFEKLMGTDKVDLILPPWGTGANFAVMPLIQKYGYP